MNIKRFDIIRYTLPNSGSVELEGVVGSLNKSDGFCTLFAISPLTEAPSLRSFYYGGDYDVKEIVSRGLDNALAYFEKYNRSTTPIGEVSKADLANHRLFLWLRGHKLRKLVRDNKRQGRLVVHRQRVGNLQIESIIDEVEALPYSSLDVKIRSIPYRTGFSFIESVDYFDNFIIVDRCELLTSDSSFARAFGVDPSLEWLLKAKEKFDRNKGRACDHIGNFQRVIEEVMDQRNITPKGAPKKVRELIKSIAREEIDRSLIRQAYSLYEQLVQTYERMYERLSDRMKKELKNTQTKKRPN